jgi:hypothetical protein
MLGVDKDRIDIIDSMTQTQKDFYLLGMCFHSAYMTAVELLHKTKTHNAYETEELKVVYTTLKRYNKKCHLTEIYEDHYGL